MVAKFALPLIILVEDDAAQRMSLLMQLKGLGELKSFRTPGDALAFAQANPADAAIVDLRIPELKGDGTEFTAKLREFDKDLAVIVRAADEPFELPDPAIHASTFRTIIKSRVSREEMWRLAREAIVETRSRRKQFGNAAAPLPLAEPLERPPGWPDEHLTLASSCGALLRSLRKNLAAQMDYTHLLVERAEQPGDGPLLDLARSNKAIFDRIVSETREFFDSPLFSPPNRGPANLNGILSLLENRYNSDPRWSSLRRRIERATPTRDFTVALCPRRTEAAFEHLLEFCLRGAIDRTFVVVKVEAVSDVRESFEQYPDKIILFNRQWLEGGRPYAKVSVTADLVDFNLEKIRREFHSPSGDFLSGSLLAFATYLTDDRCAFAAHLRPSDLIVFDVYLPLETS